MSGNISSPVVTGEGEDGGDASKRHRSLSNSPGVEGSEAESKREKKSR
jgi:hypothetical protein